MKKNKSVKINKLTKKQLQTGYKDYLTVGRLKEFIKKYNIPDHAKVLIERVEDRYYEGVDISGHSGCATTKNGIYPKGSKAAGWGVYLMPGYWYWSNHRLNERMRKEIKLRKNKKHKTQLPGIKDPRKYIVKLTDEMKNQYHPAWSCVGYEDKDFLFIDLHY